MAHGELSGLLGLFVVFPLVGDKCIKKSQQSIMDYLDHMP